MAIRRVYLDNNASTLPLPEVIDAMMTLLREEYANPSSPHQFAQSAKYRVECARQQVADLIGAAPKEIIFTSGGTESINLAIRGFLQANTPEPSAGRFVTTMVEHSAVFRVAERLAADGYDVDFVGVDKHGRIDQAEWDAKLTPETSLVSLVHANNETGVVFDVAKLGAVASDRGIPVHVDAVQSAGKLPIDVSSLPISLLSMSAHKLHGPKGAGALYQKRRTRLAPVLLGGGHERNLRAGTENVPGIVGMGVAAEAAKRDCGEFRPRVTALRDRLQRGILEAFPDAHINGLKAERVYNTANISFPGLESEAILILLSEAGISVSSGPACSSGSVELSRVLKAMGLDERIIRGAIRFSLSRFNTPEEIEYVVSLMPQLLSKLSTMCGA
ncbi:MAG: cysteine desulfurase [Phycisphaerales bacterium]|nr:MAG: cysteine desulfurase [Phycisphaerales bacterium]